MDTKEDYLALAVEKLKLMREEVPFIEVGLRVNEILDYLFGEINEKSIISRSTMRGLYITCPC